MDDRQIVFLVMHDGLVTAVCASQEAVLQYINDGEQPYRYTLCEVPVPTEVAWEEALSTFDVLEDGKPNNTDESFWIDQQYVIE